MTARSPTSGDFAAIVDAHWTAVYRLVYHMTGQTHDAEEITQETFLRAMNNWHSFQAGTNIRAWLMRIASNLFLDEKRRQKRRNVQAMEDVEGRDAAVGRDLEVKEQSELLKAALGELSETTRLVFHLRASEDMPFREVAELAGISEEAARWHMHQARTKLLKRMNDPS